MNDIVLHRLVAGKEERIAVSADQVLSITNIGSKGYYCIYGSEVKPNLDYADLLELQGAVLYPCDSITCIMISEHSPLTHRPRM